MAYNPHDHANELNIQLRRENTTHNSWNRHTRTITLSTNTAPADEHEILATLIVLAERNAPTNSELRYPLLFADEKQIAARRLGKGLVTDTSSTQPRRSQIRHKQDPLESDNLEGT